MRPRLRRVRPDISDGEILHAYATVETKLRDSSKKLLENMNQTVMNHHIWVGTHSHYLTGFCSPVDGNKIPACLARIHVCLG